MQCVAASSQSRDSMFIYYVGVGNLGQICSFEQCSCSLSRMNEYLAVDSGGYLFTTSLHILSANGDVV